MKKTLRKIKKLTYKMQANLLLVFCLVVIGLIVLIGIVVKINIKDGNRYAKKVLSQQSYTSAEIPYKRGNIYDCNGTIMADSVKVYDLAIDPKFILSQSNGKYLYKDTVVEILTKYFKIDENELLDLLEKKKESQYYVLKKELSTDIVDGYEKYIEKYKKEKNAAVNGIMFDERYERRYPLNTVGSNVVGFLYDTNAGCWGIEERYNDVLNGSTGRTYGYYDSELNLERTVKDAINGNSVVSTINSNVQKIVENHIRAFDSEVGSKNTAVMIANPNNGNIIAMASSRGIYDLNNPRDLSNIYTEEEVKNMSEEEKLDALNSRWKNYCLSDTYEPGSTFKPFVVAACLEEGLITKNQTFVCDGQEVVAEGTSPIKCAKRDGHGYITAKQALMYSCNDAMMYMSKFMGRDMFAKYQSHFYFGTRTGIDLNGEAPGIVYNADGLNALELATSSFGQGLNVTMVQMVAGFSSLVNGGYYYEPRIAEKIVNDNNDVVDNIESVLVKRTVSEDTSEFIRESMKATVEKGTANYAKVEGYSVGGKTGTAQKLPRTEGNYLVSFLGCAPCENPTVVVYVIVDQPNVSEQDNSEYAQRLAADIMKETFPHLGVAKENDSSEKEKKEAQEAISTTNEETERASFSSEGEYNYNLLDSDIVAKNENDEEIGTDVSIDDINDIEND